MSPVPYVAVTLGSNSFNMLVAITENERPIIIDKFKRKVRLAEGMDEQDRLNQQAMTRGIDCLAMFATEIENAGVKAEHVSVIATATLRRITNVDAFRQQALSVFPYPIDIISGEREAELIYRGMAATTQGDERRLVIDIGGASTEFIIGEANKVLFKTSLAIGCVTFKQQFFQQGHISQSDFDAVKANISHSLAKIEHDLLDLGWQSVLGASGSIQTVMEVLCVRGKMPLITSEVLHALQQEILALQGQAVTHIKGVQAERAPTFIPGVAILSALFEILNIQSLQLAGGALREGVLECLAAKVKSE